MSRESHFVGTQNGLVRSKYELGNIRTRLFIPLKHLYVVSSGTHPIQSNSLNGETTDRFDSQYTKRVFETKLTV